MAEKEKRQRRAKRNDAQKSRHLPNARRGLATNKQKKLATAKPLLSKLAAAGGEKKNLTNNNSGGGARQHRRAGGEGENAHARC